MHFTPRRGSTQRELRHGQLITLSSHPPAYTSAFPLPRLDKMKRSLSSGRTIALVTVLIALSQLSTSIHLPSVATLVDLLETNVVMVGAVVSAALSFALKLPSRTHSAGGR